MERTTIKEMGVRLARNATEEAQRFAMLAVEDVAVGKVHMVAHWMHLARREQLRAQRIDNAMRDAASLPYPADYHKAVLAAAQDPEMEDRSVLEGLGELARRAMQNAERTARRDPGMDIDWAQEIEDVAPQPAVSVGADPAMPNRVTIAISGGAKSGAVAEAFAKLDAMFRPRPTIKSLQADLETIAKQSYAAKGGQAR